MPKLIFTSHYMRDAHPAKLANYVKYIGTREGVEKIDESKLTILLHIFFVLLLTSGLNIFILILRN